MLDSAPTLVIHEIYRSIQGESSFVGLPCTFVRLSACNLRCRWCDTPQAFTGGTRTPLDEVMRSTLSLQTPVVLVTGGEPLLQTHTPTLLMALCDAGKTVLLETSGERDISVVDPRVHRIMDLKAPGSGEQKRNRLANIDLLSTQDEVKFVICNREDYEWARTMLARHALDQRAGQVLFSPVFDELNPEQLVDWVLEDALPVRVQVQLHKYIWGAQKQGV